MTAEVDPALEVGIATEDHTDTRDIIEGGLHPRVPDLRQSMIANADVLDLAPPVITNVKTDDVDIAPPPPQITRRAPDHQTRGKGNHHNGKLIIGPNMVWDTNLRIGIAQMVDTEEGRSRTLSGIIEDMNERRSARLE